MTNNLQNLSTSTPPSIKKWVAGIVVALPEEFATLSKHQPVQGQCFNLTDKIKLVYSGAGPANAEQAANLLISQGVDCLISWGCAAALSPELKPGALIIPKRVISDHNLEFSIEPDWLEHIKHTLPTEQAINDGSLIESRKIVANSAEKQSIYNQSGAVALDMESAAIFGVAEKSGVYGLAIRVIADPADMSLPKAVAHAMNCNGQVEIAKLLLFLLKHPGEIPALIKLGLHFQAARKTLKTVAKHLERIMDFNVNHQATL